MAIFRCVGCYYSHVLEGGKKKASEADSFKNMRVITSFTLKMAI
jgi:hypothetical protein